MKEIQYSLPGTESPITSQLGSRVTREDLYGDVIRVVEREGRRLEKGWLLPDGTLLRRGQISSAAIDDEGTPVEDPVVYAGEEKVEQIESSLESVNALNPVPLTRLAGFNTAEAYPLDEHNLQPGLYETTFNYRKGYQRKDALVLVKPDREAWLLTGTVRRPLMVGKSLAYEFFDAAGDDSAGEADPLDFSMM